MPSDRIKNVNPPRLFRTFLASILVISLGACAHYPHQGSLALVGTWKNSAGTTWTMRDDGTFEVDLDQDGKRDLWGKYKVDGDTVTLIRKGGFAPKSCKGKGVYRFNRSAGDTLQFTLISDDCKLRIKNVTLGWKRK
jgi:hypothetical protein